MITDKFPYKTLNRSDEITGRKYILSNGSKVPSVTTVLSATSPDKKEALSKWRNRIGTANADAITLESSSRGTRLHKWLENYIKNDSTGDPGTNTYSIQSHQMAHTIIKQGLVNCSEYYGTEIGLYFPNIYAGTTDLIGIHSGDEAILDFKQTNRLKKREWIGDYFLQTVAYGQAHNEVWGTKIRKGVILMCSADNVYQEFIIEGNEWDSYTDQWWKRLEQYYIKFT